MAYVAVKGGQYAIEESIRRIKYERLKDKRSVSVKDIQSGMRLMIDQVMSEAPLYSKELAATAIKQGEGSLEEAEFSINDEAPKDVTKEQLSFPTVRSERLQILTRGMTQGVNTLAYASLRGYGTVHPTVAELRVGAFPIYIADPVAPEDEEEQYYIGEIKVTEVESLIPVMVQKDEGKKEINFAIGYGIALGQNETKAISMSILDQTLENKDSGFPTSDEEFVLYHIDSVEATGFISHLKLPHYVTFQAKLNDVRKIKRGEN